MAIIISKNGKNAQKLNPIHFGLEDHLQQYIYDNPESVPLYEIKEDIQLLILAREIGTNSGPIDAIGIDRDGQIYLIETKLYKNPDKRTVVAQVLDYGASLWKMTGNFDDFLDQLNNHVQNKFGTNTTEKIKEFFTLDDEQLQMVLNQMKSNLNEGSFKFVVLMDSLEDRLKDLIIYINQNSKFDIYGVELEYYQHDSFEILIPKLYGNEVKKDIGTNKQDVTFITNEEFTRIYSTVQLGDQVKQLLATLDKMQQSPSLYPNWQARRAAKSISFTYTAPLKTKQSLTISITINNGKPNTSFEFWLYDKDIESTVIDLAAKILKAETQATKPNSTYGIVAKWPLASFSQTIFLRFCQHLSNQIDQ